MDAGGRAAAEGSVPSGKLVLAWHTNIASRCLDPQQHDGTASPDNFIMALHDALIKNLREVRYDHPALAEGYDFAEDGKSAIELCRTLRPDVITLDMVLPIMSGVAITEYVMAYFPTPILIVSASSNRGELHKTYDALAAGAVDVFEKPHGTELDGAWERGLIATVKLVSRVRVITHIRGKLGTPRRASVSSVSVETRAGTAPRRIVAIGGSTGGPACCVPAADS